MEQYGSYEVSARVGKHQINLESETKLCPRPEAFLSPLLLPTMSWNGNLETTASVCPTWLANMGQVRKIAADWWGFGGGEISAPTETSAYKGTGTGVFFTGGVDSFFTLLKSPDLDSLIFVEGFDVPLNDASRIEKVRRSIGDVAASKGLDPITIRTNLRRNPDFRRISWELSHISALAAIAHVLSERVAKFYVAASDVPPPSGTHPDLDRLWSSSTVQIVGHGWNMTRLDRVKAIADDPLVHRHLRVCWENRSTGLNCGVCEKCVRTQLQFATAGTLGSIESFPAGDLVQRVDGVPKVGASVQNQWAELAEELTAGDLKAAINRLIERSARARMQKAAIKAVGVSLARRLRAWLS
jgi:hypothetical protein